MHVTRPSDGLVAHVIRKLTPGGEQNTAVRLHPSCLVSVLLIVDIFLLALLLCRLR